MKTVANTLACLVFCLASGWLEAAPPSGTQIPESGDKAGGKMMEERLRQQQDHLLKLHDMMHQIMNARDDAERERLKEEQRKLMRENLRLHQQQIRSRREGRSEAEKDDL